MKEIKLSDVHSVFSYKSGSKFGPAIHHFVALVETWPGYGTEIEEEVFQRVLDMPHTNTFWLDRSNPYDGLYRNPNSADSSYITRTEMDGRVYTLCFSGYGTEESLEKFGESMKSILLEDHLGSYRPVWDVKMLVGDLDENLVVRVDRDHLNGHDHVPYKEWLKIDAIQSVPYLKSGPKK